MANITGDFDVVMEFAILTVDRVLAAMHRAERFPHSLSVRVDDNPLPGTNVRRPSVVAGVDVSGDAIADHTMLGGLAPLTGASAAAFRISGLNPVVNPGLLTISDPPVVPSHLQGAAQLQLSPPRIELSDPTGARLTVKLEVMARYFPDSHTPRLKEFLRGELQLSAATDQVVSQQRNIIDVNLKADQLGVFFQQFYPDPTHQALSPEDLAAVHLFIRNALKTGFLPSNNPLPGTIDYAQFKALAGNPDVIAVMLNMASFDPATGRHEDPLNPGDPATMNSNSVAAGDDFTLALGQDFLGSSFASLLDYIKTHKFSFPVYQWPFGSANYTVLIDQATFALQTGNILITITGFADGDSSWTPNFGFTARLKFTLQANGDTVDLIAPDVSGDDVDIHNSWFVNTFGKGKVVGGIQGARDAALKQKDPNSRNVFGQVNDLLSADRNVGQFLRTLLKPPEQQPGDPTPQDVWFLLWWNSVDIQSSAVVLHGSLAVADWPPVYVEFEQIPASTGGGFHGVGGTVVTSQGTDYSALNSWIPGGSIQKYEWAPQGYPQPYSDQNRFVLLHIGREGTAVAAAVVGGGTHVTAPPDLASTGLVSAYTPLCLTVVGNRIPSSGQFIPQQVSGSACGATTVSLLQGVEATPGGEAPMVAMTRPGPGGQVEVAGHAVAQRDTTNRNAPNRLVHFADDKTASSLQFLVDALRESKSDDAATATAILAVVTPQRLATARYTPGVIYAEDEAGAWARAFGVKTARRPLTLLIGPKGDTLWHHEGELDSAKLSSILARHLARTGPIARSVSRLNLRIGQIGPNFLVPLGAGRTATLRKMGAANLVFCRSSSPASIQAAADLQQTLGKAAGQGPLLTIFDGETPEVAQKAARENGLTAIIVPDPQRNISTAYGVSIWPTIVSVNKFGVVRGIRYGRYSAGPGGPPTGGRADVYPVK